MTSDSAPRVSAQQPASRAVGHSVSDGVTPIGQGWTNARGLRGLGGPKPDPIFVYFNISSVRC